jgi:hypothetical protein
VRHAVWSELVSATEIPVERQFSGIYRAICPSSTSCFRRERRISVMARHAFQLELLREFALAKWDFAQALRGRWWTLEHQLFA